MYQSLCSPYNTWKVSCKNNLFFVISQKHHIYIYTYSSYSSSAPPITDEVIRNVST